LAKNDDPHKRHGKALNKELKLIEVSFFLKQNGILFGVISNF
jgi:hypothetical protein